MMRMKTYWKDMRRRDEGEMWKIGHRRIMVRASSKANRDQGENEQKLSARMI